MTPTGHERPALAAMHCRALALTIGRWALQGLRSSRIGSRSAVFFTMAGAMT
jgi:hypothetical protein